VRVLVVNPGSSSLKLSVVEGERVGGAVALDAPTPDLDEGALRNAVERLGAAEAVGHRFVHGGDRFRQPTLLDAAAERALRNLIDLAPLHQQRSLNLLQAVRNVLPDVPQVACFDTAFHADMPAEATSFALPAEWRERWGLRRYGFHGFAHDHATRAVAALLGVTPDRLVSCHLGAGASLCAIRAGRSVDTTMGFTPLDGLVMATRSGAVDPGLLLWLLEHTELDARNVQDGLEHRSGLLGLAGTADMRDIDPDSEAFSVYVHRLCGSIAAMVAALGGLDALTFSGGVGENSGDVRSAVASRLGFLGIDIDTERNASGPPRREISVAGAVVRCFVIPAGEDLEIARAVRNLLARAAG